MDERVVPQTQPFSSMAVDRRGVEGDTANSVSCIPHRTIRHLGHASFLALIARRQTSDGTRCNPYARMMGTGQCFDGPKRRASLRSQPRHLKLLPEPGHSTLTELSCLLILILGSSGTACSSIVREPRALWVYLCLSDLFFNLN